MIDTVTHEDFAGHLQTTFQIDAGQAGTTDLVLIEVTPDSSEQSRRKDARLPFSVIFRSASEETLPQAIYRVSHGSFETMELFLVPIGPDEDSSGMRYEAIFT